MPSETATSYHSLDIGNKNTWDDWHLVPTSRPVISMPELKTQYVDIPGADGHIDMSEALTRYPVYENREGSLEFIVENGFKDWSALYSEIADYLHGLNKQVILNDDPGYYYEGRMFVESWDSPSDGTWSTITLGYNFQPYKMSISTATEDWLWDPFDLEHGVIHPIYFRNIEFNDSSNWTTIEFEADTLGRKVVVPTITANFSMAGSYLDIRFINPEIDFDRTITLHTSGTGGSGTRTVTDSTSFALSSINPTNRCKLMYKGSGNGTFTIDFRTGRL